MPNLPAPALRGAGIPSFVFLAFLASLGALGRGVLALEASPGATEQVAEGYNRVAEELLCYCGCARQTVHECTCSVALELRTEWEGKLSAGTTPDQIIAEYIDAHGEQSRNVPPKKGINLIAWFGPGIAIVVAGAATLVILTLWTARGRARAAAAAAAGADAGPAEGLADERARERLERELREFDA